MFDDLLDLSGVQISRQIETPDGMGGTSLSSTTATLLHKAAIWSPSQSQRYMSDRMSRVSTHVLVTRPSDYSFNANDVNVIYAGVTYKITGPSDNVAFKDEITLTGLEVLL